MEENAGTGLQRPKQRRPVRLAPSSLSRSCWGGRGWVLWPGRQRAGLGRTGVGWVW